MSDVHQNMIKKLKRLRCNPEIKQNLKQTQTETETYPVNNEKQESAINTKILVLAEPGHNPLVT